MDEEAKIKRQREEEERKNLTSRDDRAVAYLRIAVICIIVVAAFLVSFFAYWFLGNVEQEDFENEFNAQAQKVVESFYNSIDGKLAAADSMSIAITRHALTSNSTFPNVTVSNFEILGSSARILLDSYWTIYAPLVSNEDRAGWEEYANEHQTQLDESYGRERTKLQVDDHRYNRSFVKDANITGDDQSCVNLDVLVPYIYGFGGNNDRRPDGSGPFFVYWQSTPVLPLKPMLNFDMRTHPDISGGLTSMLQTNQAVLERTTHPDPLRPSDGDCRPYLLKNGQYRYESEVFERDPMAAMLYPVYDNYEEDRNIAGLLIVAIYWRLHFANVLAESATVMAVLENSFNQSFSYLLDGPDVTYLGLGDHHNPKYDSLLVHEEVSKVSEDQADPTTRSFTAAKLDSEYCSYRLRVYPVEGMESQYITNKPVIYACVAAAIFVFTTMIFLAYDYLNIKRQHYVMMKAVQSGVIVSSLFPKAVRARLYEENSQEKQTLQEPWFVTDSQAAHRAMRSKNDLLAMLNDVNAPVSSKPIVDKYDNASVLFADLAGFTQWSSSREPDDVFILLETLYRTMDDIALKLGVFKIETIGDCYLAVTGLPEPQPDHAAILARFASECVDQFVQITEALVDTLGDDTVNLGLRVGIHSGPVTAGVLRGQKSRFQIFGDTVNTASRMESNGLKGRIQISEATAKELEAHGKSDWFIPREDMISAKGKGQMQTYWLRVVFNESTISSVPFGGTLNTASGFLDTASTSCSTDETRA